jgi:hypothetical protein
MSGGLRKGQLIRIRMLGRADDWCRARVAELSTTGDERSVILELNDMVRCPSGFISGALPITVNYKAETVEGLMGGEYEIEISDERA